MKTSNKLLTGLLIAIFIIPLGLFMAFKQMVNEGDYTAIRKHDNHIASGKTGDYSVVKITVPKFKKTDSRRILICHLHSAKEGRYTFRKFNVIDSISIANERDTLFIKYIIKPHQNTTPTYYMHYNVDLYLPDMKDIVVNRATLRMDSIDAVTNPEINIHLTDAIFQMGDGINRKGLHNPLKLHKTILQYNNLSINAESSQLIFGYYLRVDSLSLNIAKDSRLTIANDFQAGKIEGTISNQTTIISNMSTIKKLGELKDGRD